jgi:hypothetical protein
MRGRNFIVARSCVVLADAAPPAMRTHAIRGRCSRAQNQCSGTAHSSQVIPWLHRSTNTN